MLTIELGGHSVTTTTDVQELIVNGQTIVLENVEGQVFLFGRPLPDRKEEDNGDDG